MDEDNSTKLSMLFAAHHAEGLAYCVRLFGCRGGVFDTTGCSRSGWEEVNRYLQRFPTVAK